MHTTTRLARRHRQANLGHWACLDHQARPARRARLSHRAPPDCRALSGCWACLDHRARLGRWA